MRDASFAFLEPNDEGGNNKIHNSNRNRSLIRFLLCVVRPLELNYRDSTRDPNCEKEGIDSNDSNRSSDGKVASLRHGDFLW